MCTLLMVETSAPERYVAVGNSGSVLQFSGAGYNDKYEAHLMTQSKLQLSSNQREQKYVNISDIYVW